MMRNIFFSILAISIALNCASNEKEAVNVPQLSLKDVEGQWTLIKIDTIFSKQSLEVNEAYNNSWVEHDRSIIEPVDGKLKCVSFCPEMFYPKDIEFANDSVFEYVFPTHIRSFNQLSIENNQLVLKGINSIWYGMMWDTSLDVKLNQDTLRIEYLEETGLYLSEVYKRNSFDQELVNILRTYEHNLLLAEGKYALVHYQFHTVEYDSPFEHYHSFPHDVPETLNFSKEDLLQILSTYLV